MQTDAQNVVTDTIVRMRKYLPSFKPKTVKLGKRTVTLFQGEGESIEVIYQDTRPKKSK